MTYHLAIRMQTDKAKPQASVLWVKPNLSAYRGESRLEAFFRSSSMNRKCRVESRLESASCTVKTGSDFTDHFPRSVFRRLHNIALCDTNLRQMDERKAQVGLVREHGSVDGKACLTSQ